MKGLKQQQNIATNVSRTFETIWHDYISYQLFILCVLTDKQLGENRAKHMLYHRGAGQKLTFALQRDVTED